MHCPLRRVAARLQAKLRLSVFIPLLALALAATWYGLGPSLDRIVGLTGRRFVDMQPAIAATEVVSQLQAYTPEAVRFYLGWLAFDFAWPLLTYSAMLFMAAWLLRQGGAAADQRFWLLVAVAYTTVLMDWAENLCFAAVMAVPLPQASWLAQLAVLFHRGKLALNLVFNVGFLVVLALAARAGLQRLRTRHAPGRS